jgi:hypothetical protein
VFYYVRRGRALLIWLHSTMLEGRNMLPLVFTCHAHQEKNGDLQFCVDYWWLNDITKKNCFTLTRPDDTQDVIAATTRVLTLDLKSGYWKVSLHYSNKKTSFSTGQGLWQFTDMPSGLCNASAMFEQLTESILQGLLMKPAWCSWLIWSLLTGHPNSNLIICQRCSSSFEGLTLNSPPRSTNCSRRRYGTRDIWPEGMTMDSDMLKATR